MLGQLPNDIYGLIAQHLQGPDLAQVAQVIPEFKEFFQREVAPVFRQEFLRVSKILPYLQRLHFFRPTSVDMRYDQGDAAMMSFILNREVEDGEIFEEEIEYNVWRTTHGVMDTDASMHRIMEEYNYNRYIFDIISPTAADNFDEYLFEHYG
jgi:hypothetical protein